MKHLALLAALMIAAAACPAASAQTGTAIPSAEPSAHAAEAAIAEYVVQDSVGEVQICRYALAKTQSAAVRDFANTMITDHTRIAVQAQALGHQLGASDLALKPSQDAQIMLAKLGRTPASQFDMDFLHAQIDDHRNDIDQLRTALEATPDGAAKQFEEAMLPQYEQHLSLAQKAMDTLAASE